MAVVVLRHLSKKRRKSLSSGKQGEKWSAEGEWYEVIIYEKLLQLACTSKDYSIIGKGADVHSRDREKPRIGQDGLCYDTAGAIVARGNGQDLSEFDILLTKRHHEYAFLEIKNSANFPRDMDLTLEYKKRLLSLIILKKIQR